MSYKDGIFGRSGEKKTKVTLELKKRSFVTGEKIDFKVHVDAKEIKYNVSNIRVGFAVRFVTKYGHNE